MKIAINKNAKKILSVAIALIMLFGTFFVANVGVTLDANAAVVEDTWDGSKVEPTTTDDLGNIIITNAEELAWIALDGASATTGKNYKVVDNAVFNMNGMSGITLNSTAADVKAATKDASKLWCAGSDKTFVGNFDGNGLIVYNINGNGAGTYGYSGLFPIAKQTANGENITIKNVSVYASYFTAYHNVGAVVGLVNAPGTSATVTFENLAAVNCYISDNGNTNSACQRTVSTIAGSVGHSKITLNNCFAKDNTLSAANIVGGLVGNTSAYAPVGSFSNSIVIGSPVVPVDNLPSDANPLQSPLSGATFTNVYTDQASSKAGATTLTIDKMTGANATANMNLDFAGTWFANTSGTPELKVFHNINAINNGDTHIERCADCGLVGLTTGHYYNEVDYTTNTTSCVCGAFVFGTYDVWDGTKASSFASGSGTEADPYIIKTVEQLFLMVRSTGVNADGTPVYYKVADDVNALYINDTRAYKSQAEFEAAAATLKNWSTGLTKEIELCPDSNNCYGVDKDNKAQHRDGYVDYFGGRFDGNGVTIYGLYSQTSVLNHWNNGVGFVPMLTGDAVIKNVVFDTNYIKSDSAVAAVVTSSLGIWDGQYYNPSRMCPYVSDYVQRPAQCNAAILNVAVRNSYIKATYYRDWNAKFVSCVSGFVSSILVPNSLKIDNCLFDGSNSTFIDTVDAAYNTDTDAKKTKASQKTAFTATYENNITTEITGCVSVVGDSGVTAFSSTETFTDNSGIEHFYVANSAQVDTNEFTSEDAPMLNWIYWEAAEGKATTLKNNNTWTADYYGDSGEYIISARKESVLTSTDKYSGFKYSALRNNRGVFNAYNTLQGSGTEEDPYIISDADTLYMIIASGGTRFGVPQYYKLSCNIDLEGKQWVDTDIFENTQYNVIFYKYQPFAGVLDGDGHTISNLYAADDDYAGFIPVLEGGTVKNINFNNVSVSSSGNYAGVVTGWMYGGEVTNCTVENGFVYSDSGYGSGIYVVYNDDDCNIEEYGYIADCYYRGINADGEEIEAYISENNEDGVVFSTLDDIKEEILKGNTEYTSKWYLGAGENAVPHLIENAKKQPCVDIDGDGVGEEYSASDISALKSHLLWKDGYDYIYGDVNGNGKTDMRDLAALQRIMVGGSASEYDGFWPNVKDGKFIIYYDENDNYDFARKFELYLERVTGTDVTKSLGSSDANFTINIKTEGDVNSYSATYDVDTAKLVIKGGSFTAVEEAVDAVIANTTSTGLPATISGTVSAEKAAVTVDGNTYYYAWGDEFNTDVAGTVSYDNWILRNKSTDSTPNEIDSDFEGIRPATDDEALLLNQISNGKLTLKRGLTGASSGYKYYMSGISTMDSMLFNQGYIEMVATVPSDGAAFPAWWLLTSYSHKDNSSIDSSLYSKVYELNESFDGVTRTPTGSNVQSFKYKLPTQTLEIDLFEIIQRPTVTRYSVSKSTDYNIKYNIHKWYIYSLDKTDDAMTVYHLDWAKAPASGAFPTKLLTATGTNGENYTTQSSSIKINTSNLKDGTVNGAATYEGFANGKDYLGNAKPMEQNMESYRENNQITARKYGFLWTEDSMTFILYNGTDANASVLKSFTVNASQMKYQNSESDYNGDNYGFGQYAYMLIENHIFTSSESSSYGRKVLSGIGECDMIIDYVRLYQLDGARSIITPESEALSAR